MHSAAGKADEAFRRYLQELSTKGEVGPEVLEGLSEEERRDVVRLIEVFDLVGGIDCPPNPSATFLARARSRIHQAQEALHAGPGLETGLLGAPAGRANDARGTTFGMWLRNSRRSSGLSHDELGRAAGCSGALIANMEGGYAKPTELPATQLRNLVAEVQGSWSQALQLVLASMAVPTVQAAGMARSLEEKRDFSQEYQELIDAAKQRPDGESE